MFNIFWRVLSYRKMKKESGSQGLEDIGSKLEHIIRLTEQLVEFQRQQAEKEFK